MLISSNIKRVRERRNMTQTQLSVATDIPQSRISAYEREKITPTITVLARIAAELNCEWHELVEVVE